MFYNKCQANLLPMAFGLYNRNTFAKNKYLTCLVFPHTTIFPSWPILVYYQF